MVRKSLLIIKHGFSETCDHIVSPIVSYGDVFRCTCLLEDFKGWTVHWITAQKAKELLSGNHLIDRLVLADSPEEIPPGRLLGRYDTIINLEKQKDWCEFAAGLEAGERFGFSRWTGSSRQFFYPASDKALSDVLERSDYRPVQETLFKTIGREWTGQRYVLGYHSRVREIYDVGLNYHVGPKWPTKAWPSGCWDQLNYELTEQGYAVCRQQALNSIRHYMDWIASCRMIITCDSLGLHLALAMKKKVVAMFGPTAPQQIYMYGQGVKLTPTCERSCIGCMRARCDFEHSCMEFITVDMVLDTVEMLMPNKSKTATRSDSQSNWLVGAVT